MITILQDIVVIGGRAKNVQNKIKRLKDKFSAAYDMVNTSGFGWDDVQKCVIVDAPEILEEYLKKHPTKNYVANKPFLAYERLANVFGKDRATGSMAESAADVTTNVNVSNEEEGECIPSPNSNPSNNATSSRDLGKKNKRKFSASDEVTKIIEKGFATVSEEMQKMTKVITSSTNDLTELKTIHEQLKTMVLFSSVQSSPIPSSPTAKHTLKELLNKPKANKHKSIMEEVTDTEEQLKKDSAIKKLNFSPRMTRSQTKWRQVRKDDGTADTAESQHRIEVGKSCGFNKRGRKAANEAWKSTTGEHGLGKGDYKSTWIKDIVCRNNIDFLGIQETKRKNLSDLTIRSIWGSNDFDFEFKSSSGQSGGLACIWNRDLFKKNHCIARFDCLVIKDGMRGRALGQYAFCMTLRRLQTSRSCCAGLDQLRGHADGSNVATETV
ncbi:hypothetical protein LXL04_008035 [Taraxacum kok-saghyz]